METAYRQAVMRRENVVRTLYLLIFQNNKS